MAAKQTRPPQGSPAAMGSRAGRRWATALLGLFFIFMLTGFTTVESTFRVTEEDDVEVTLLVTLDREVYAELQQAGTLSLADLEADWTLGDQATVTPYENAERVGVRIVQTFPGGVRGDGGIFQGSLTSEADSIWRDYVLDLTVDMADPVLTSDVDTLVFAVELPVPAKEHNGTAEADGRRITWTLQPGERHHLTLRARVYDWQLVAYVLAIVAGSMGTTAFLVYLDRQQRQLRAEMMANEGTGAGRDAPGGGSW